MDKMKQVGCGDWLDVLFEKCCQREQAMHGLLELHKKKPFVRTPIMQHVRHVAQDESRQQLSQDVQLNDKVYPICDELIDPSAGDSSCQFYAKAPAAHGFIGNVLVLGKQTWRML